MIPVKTNSKYLKKNDIFICVHNEIEDRHKYIKDAIRKKPACIIVDRDINIKTKIPIIKVNNTNDTFYQILNNYYNIKNINLIGVTGTDGKTTTACIIKELLSNFSNTAYLGTNGYSINNINLNTRNTTPSEEEIFFYIDKTKKSNGKNLVLEVSSEGLLQNRCHNLNFSYTVLTNITGDHLNIHKNINNYVESKSKLFSQNNSINILNIDDKHFKEIKKKANGKIITYGKNKNATYHFFNIKEINNNTNFSLKINSKIYNISSPLKGIFNVYNLVASIALVNLFEINVEKIINCIPNLKQIDGRMQYLNFGQDYKIVLDYAHTTNATLNILKYMRSICVNKLITVVGCAGSRDNNKRNKIGKIVSDYSDYVFFTSDDPRFEKPSNIIYDMTKDLIKDNYSVVINRKKAIYKALKMAKENDIVLILGKGIDNYMAIKDKYIKYSDYKVVKKYYSL